jgi:hypothetical protein
MSIQKKLCPYNCGSEVVNYLLLALMPIKILGRRIAANE